MKYDNAYRSVVEFLGSDAGSGFDLNDAQAEELAKRLVMRVKVDIVMSPEAVLPHAEALFPKPDADYVRRTTPPQQPKQTLEQARAVLTAFFDQGLWAKVAPGTIPPMVKSSDGKYVVGSRINYDALQREVNAIRSKIEALRADHLAGIVNDLFNRGALEKYPEQPAPPPPPPSKEEQARELAKKIAAKDRSLQDRDSSPIRGAREAVKPLVQLKVVLTEEQRVALNEKKRAEDSIIAEAQHRIQNYASYSHSKTYSHRSQLQDVFRQAMDEGLEAKDVLARVDQAIDRLAGSSSIR